MAEATVNRKSSSGLVVNGDGVSSRQSDVQIRIRAGCFITFTDQIT